MYQLRLGSSLEDLDCRNHSCYIKQVINVPEGGLEPKVMHLIGRVVDDEVHPVQKQGKRDATEGMRDGRELGTRDLHT